MKATLQNSVRVPISIFRIAECRGLTDVISRESLSRSLSKKLGSSSACDMLEHKRSKRRLGRWVLPSLRVDSAISQIIELVSC